MLNRRQLLALAGGAGAAAVVLPPLHAAAVRGSGPAVAESTMDMGGMAMNMGGTGGDTATEAAAWHSMMVSDMDAPVATGFTGTPFSMPMIVPRELRPISRQFGTDVYRLPIRPAEVELVAGVPSDVLTYDGTFVGPTIRARAGRKVRITFDNEMTESTNVHLHGTFADPVNDGQPFDVFQPGESRTYEYANRQLSQTLWYHDHDHVMVAEHVYHGLHGFYLLEDDFERSLNLPRDEYDVPIMLAEATFDDSGKLIYDFFDFNRPTILVNGRPQPFFQVAARKYRLRLLNASNHGVLTLNLGGAEMLQVTSDQGLLPRSVPLTELVLAPAERADVIVDFSRFRTGSQVTLSETRGPILRFDVTHRAHDDSHVPTHLRPMAKQPRPVAERTVVLSTNFDTIASYINGKVYDQNRVDFRLRLGTSEIWTISNIDTEFGGVDHAFHLHHTKFRVLDRDGKPPAAWETGWKDTVLVAAGQSVRIQITIDGHYTGRYVCHCHMLEHAEAGMMANMELYT
jgi:spore coat protein A, manganese oxidase